MGPETDTYPAHPAPSCFEEIGTPEALAKLYAALGKAQAAFPPIPRSKGVTIRSEKGTYSFAYAPLEELLALTRPSLATNGLAVMTPVIRRDSASAASVLVIVAHEAGARLVFSYAFTPQADMKQAAGQWTYLRRYGYSAALNLAADDDDDDVPSQQAPQRQSEASKPIQRAPKEKGVSMNDVARAMVEMETEGRNTVNEYGLMVDTKTGQPVEPLQDASKPASLYYARYTDLVAQAKVVLPEEQLATLPVKLAPTANDKDVIAAGKRVREALELAGVK